MSSRWSNFLLLQYLHSISNPDPSADLQGYHQLSEHGMCRASGSTVPPQDFQGAQFVLLPSFLVNASHFAALNTEGERDKKCIFQISSITALCQLQWLCSGVLF